MSQLYRFPIPGLQEVGFLRVQNAAQPMEIERHDGAFELLYLQSGEKMLRVGDRDYRLRGGDLLIIRPGEPHGARDVVQNRSSMWYFLISDPMSAPDFLHLDSACIRVLSERLRTLRLLHADNALRRIVGQIAACLETVEQDAFARPRLNALVLLMLDELVHQESPAEDDVPEDIRRVVEYINDHPSEMFSVQQLADVLGLSQIRFKQKFKQSTGIPPAEYVARTHVRLAEHQLRSTGDSVTAIAMRLGFSSDRHLCRLFKSYNGMTPTEYRRKY